MLIAVAQERVPVAVAQVHAVGVEEATVLRGRPEIGVEAGIEETATVPAACRESGEAVGISTRRYATIRVPTSL